MAQIISSFTNKIDCFCIIVFRETSPIDITSNSKHFNTTVLQIIGTIADYIQNLSLFYFLLCKIFLILTTYILILSIVAYGRLITTVVLGIVRIVLKPKIIMKSISNVYRIKTSYDFINRIYNNNILFQNSLCTELPIWRVCTIFKPS